MLCLQILAEKLAQGLPIRHGMVVDQIVWGGEGVTLHCQGGEQVQADAVILTVSLGVLKVVMLLHCRQPPSIMQCHLKLRSKRSCGIGKSAVITVVGCASAVMQLQAISLCTFESHHHRNIILTKIAKLDTSISRSLADLNQVALHGRLAAKLQFAPP